MRQSCSVAVSTCVSVNKQTCIAIRQNSQLQTLSTQQYLCSHMSLGDWHLHVGSRISSRTQKTNYLGTCTDQTQLYGVLTGKILKIKGKDCTL